MSQVEEFSVGVPGNGRAAGDARRMFWRRLYWQSGKVTVLALLPAGVVALFDWWEPLFLVVLGAVTWWLGVLWARVAMRDEAL